MTELSDTGDEIHPDAFWDVDGEARDALPTGAENSAVRPRRGSVPDDESIALEIEPDDGRWVATPVGDGSGGDTPRGDGPRGAAHTGSPPQTTGSPGAEEPNRAVERLRQLATGLGLVLALGALGVGGFLAWRAYTTGVDPVGLDGTEIFAADLGASGTTVAALDDARIALHNAETDQVAFFDRSNGRELWRSDVVDVEPAAPLSGAGPSLDPRPRRVVRLFDGVAVLSKTGGEGPPTLRGYNAMSGAELWSVDGFDLDATVAYGETRLLAFASSRSLPEETTDPDSPPSGRDGPPIAMIDVTNGAIVWDVDRADERLVAAYGNVVVTTAPTVDSVLAFARNPETGASVWVADPVEGLPDLPGPNPYVADQVDPGRDADAVLLWGGGTLVAVDAETGTQRWAQDLAPETRFRMSTDRNSIVACSIDRAGALGAAVLAAGSGELRWSQTLTATDPSSSWSVVGTYAEAVVFTEQTAGSNCFARPLDASTVQAYTVSDGTPEWALEGGRVNAKNIGYSSPVLTGADEPNEQPGPLFIEDRIDVEKRTVENQGFDMTDGDAVTGPLDVGSVDRSGFTRVIRDGLVVIGRDGAIDLRLNDEPTLQLGVEVSRVTVADNLLFVEDTDGKIHVVG